MVKIALCDDVGERLEHKKEMLQYCHKELFVDWDIFSLENTNVNEVFERANEFSIFFIHKDMRRINGIEFAMNIRNRNEKALIILMTENLNNMLQALDVVVFHFLLEPISKKKMYSMLEKAIRYLGIRENPFRGYCCREEFQIEQEYIFCFEKDRRKVRIYTLFGVETCYMTTEEILGQLNMKLFARCHQSYIVNLNFIKRIKSDSLELMNGMEVNISRTYREKFRQEYFEFLSKKTKSFNS